MPNPFKDWARMYGANRQYLESQGRPSSFLGQIGDISNRIHEAADASEIGVKMIGLPPPGSTAAPGEPGARPV